MPVFQVHVPAGRFSLEQKPALGRALPLALHEALGIPVEDQFVSITGHGPDEFFLDPGYMGVERSGGDHHGPARRRTPLVGQARPGPRNLSENYRDARDRWGRGVHGADTGP